MSAAGLSPQTIVTHSKVVKMVVASAVNAEGEEVYPRKWNHNFVGMPIVDPTKQHRPTVTQAELQGILAAIKPRYTVLVALLAGTGLRIGEALGLKTDDLTSECTGAPRSTEHLARSRATAKDRERRSCDRHRGTARHNSYASTSPGRRVTCFPRETALLCHKEMCIGPYTPQVRRAGSIRSDGTGGSVAQSPGTGRPDWIVARARSKPYGQVCHSVERGR